MSDTVICEPNWIIQVGLPIGTFIGGFLVSWLTLSKKDRLEHKQRLYKNAKELSDEQETAYNEFISALSEYISANEPTMKMFIKISTTGDNYFRRLKSTAEAIMNDSVDSLIRDETLLPMLKEAVVKNLPTYYEVLNKISSKKGFDYHGELRRSNYESIFSAVEKYT